MNTQTLPFTKNLAIMASAGTGKTYQLAMRCISLLLAGAKPEEIAAITFSRKAAGEILEKIVSILLELIQKENKRDEAVKAGFIPPGTSPDQLALVLRALLACRNKLHIETNDSFLFQIIQAAPAEFGIRGEITMIDEKDDRPRQRAMLRTLHDPQFAGSDLESENRRREIYQILRDCSRGKEKTTLYAEITELLKNHYRAFLNFPGAEQWKLPDHPASTEDLLTSAQIAELRSQFDALMQDEACTSKLTDGIIKKFTKLADCVEKLPADYQVRLESTDVDKLFPLFQTIKTDSGTAVFRYNRNDYELCDPLFQILEKWKCHLVELEYNALEKKTQAVYELMKTFEASFSTLTLASGKITFADILYLINSKQKNDFGTLQVLQERLGLSVGHYLLDEFRDTSTDQWSAFKDLVLDVIQNRDPDRVTSFFMVGDIKQSIYQWREGNPALFTEICEEQGFRKEDRAGQDDDSCGGILKSLACSYRSSTPVLQLVNDIFQRAKEPLVFPKRLKEQAGIFAGRVEKMEFKRHESGLSAKKHPERGCSLVLTKPAIDVQEHDLLTWQTVCALIRKLDPFSPKRKEPLSVAVLFRNNDEITECYEAMKRLAPELDVSMEGTVKLKDSSSYAVFRQLLRLAAHPGDNAASAYLDMIRTQEGCGGLDEIRKRLFPDDPGCSLSRRIREELDQAGASHLLQRFRDAFPNTGAESEAMECLADALAAQEAEGAGALSPDERITQLDEYEGVRRSMTRTVQLMTIHKSKGLGFDIVILPLRAKTPRSGYKGVVRDEKNKCCYFEPNKAFLFQFPEVEKNANTREENSIYELGCTVYVALTRAKRSTIVILPDEKTKSTASQMLPSDIVRIAGSAADSIESKESTEKFMKDLGPFLGTENPPLTPIYCAGDPFWAEHPAMEDEEASEPKEKKPSDGEKEFRAELQKQWNAHTTHDAVCSRHAGGSDPAPPSSHSFEIRPEARFVAGTAAGFGTRVHEILRELEWLGSEEETKQFLHRFEADPEAVCLLKTALAKPDIAGRLRKPDSGVVRLFREQPFLLRTEKNGPPINGIIDRAVVEFDGAGKPVRAEVIDFKTDAAEDPEVFRTNYCRQLRIYRCALAALTGLPESKIDCTILALRPGLAVSL